MAARFPAAAHAIAAEGVKRLRRLPGRAYARLYLDRLVPIVDGRARAGCDGRLCARPRATWRCGCRYEDVIRVAAAQDRAGALRAASRARCSAEADEPVVVTEILKPGIEEIAAILPPRLARCVRGAPMGAAARQGLFGLHVKTTSVAGFALLGAGRAAALPAASSASRSRSRRSRLARARVRGRGYRPAPRAEIAECARLIKGYGDTHARGTANYARIFAAVIQPALARPDQPAAARAAVGLGPRRAPRPSPIRRATASPARWHPWPRRRRRCGPPNSSNHKISTGGHDARSCSQPDPCARPRGRPCRTRRGAGPQYRAALSHWVPAAHPLHGGGFTEWINSIRQASNGTIRITLFPSEQLGRAADHYDMARNGIADITYVNPGYTPGRFPIIALGEIPFLVANAKGGSQALHEWYQRYAEQEMQGVRVCTVFAHDPGTFHMKREIRTPDQIRGLRIRAANGTIAQFVTSLGGTNVQVSAPEAREVLERGIADGITFPWRSIMLFGIDRVVSYSMDVPLYVSDVHGRDQPRGAPAHVAGAARGHGPALHPRMVAPHRLGLGRFRGLGPHHAVGASGLPRLPPEPAGARAMAPGRRSLARAHGRTTCAAPTPATPTRSTTPSSRPCAAKRRRTDPVVTRLWRHRVDMPAVRRGAALATQGPADRMPALILSGAAQLGPSEADLRTAERPQTMNI